MGRRAVAEEDERRHEEADGQPHRATDQAHGRAIQSINQVNDGTNWLICAGVIPISSTNHACFPTE